MAEYDGGNASNVGQGETYGGGDATTEYTSTAMDGGYASLDDADITPSTILMRRDIESNWEAKNPVLAAGEIGVVTDKRYFKMGDGDNNWNSLKGYGFDGNIVQELGDSETSVMSQNAVTTVLAGMTEDINTALNNLVNSIEEEFTTKINEETTKRIDADTAIKNTMVKSNVSENEAFNDVVKELYFDKECDVSKIAQIRIKRNGSSVDYLNIYEMFIIDTANKYHSCTFVGRTAENDAVNAGTVYWSSGTSSLFPNETSRNVAMYAVIDWDKLTDQQGANKADTFEATINPRVNNIKFHPVIYSYVNMANMMGVSTLNEEEI